MATNFCYLQAHKHTECVQNYHSVQNKWYLLFSNVAIVMPYELIVIDISQVSPAKHGTSANNITYARKEIRVKDINSQEEISVKLWNEQRELINENHLGRLLVIHSLETTVYENTTSLRSNTYTCVKVTKKQFPLPCLNIKLSFHVYIWLQSHCKNNMDMNLPDLVNANPILTTWYFLYWNNPMSTVTI